ncbi:MAG: hypothetical protein AMXMBFR64_37930 [Myxococcales bacterium]
MGGARFEAKAAFDDLWIFDFPQNSWFKVQSPVPTNLVRGAHRMWHVPNAPDQSTFLVFGGLVGSVVQNDLWRVVIHPTGSASFDRLPIPAPLPPPRGSFAGAIDSAGLLLIFGGTQTGINSLGDTWTLDTNAIWPAMEKAGL